MKKVSKEKNIVKKKKYLEIGSQVIDNKGDWKHRLVVGTPTMGTVRIEWSSARYNQIIPTNWSMIELLQWMPTIAPLRYLVSDAQNIIVRSAIEREAEWLFLLESDNILPGDAFIRLNEYMRRKTVPVVSALYFTKSVPPEPMIYRGKGDSFYTDWKMGDKVWASGVPTGCLLIHMSIIRAMWEDSGAYVAGGIETRRVFNEPAKVWYDGDKGLLQTSSGTSDLAWCNRVMEDKYFEKAGWPKYQKMKHPFLVDTNIFTKHIDEAGRQWPIEVPKEYLPEKKKSKKL